MSRGVPLPDASTGTDRGILGISMMSTCVSALQGSGAQLAWSEVARGGRSSYARGPCDVERSRRPLGAKHAPYGGFEEESEFMPEPARPLGTDDADDLRLYLEAAAREPLPPQEGGGEPALLIEHGKGGGGGRRAR